MLGRDLLKRDAFHPALGDCNSPDEVLQTGRPGNAAADAVFFAVQPPPATAPCISRLSWHLRNKHRLTGKPLRPGCFHVSLLFAGYHGQMPPATLDAFIRAAGTVAMPRFRIGFDWAASLRHTGKRPLVLRGDDGVSGLLWLRDRLVAATMDVVGGIPAARSNFTPHLTLLYDEAEIREEPVEEIGWPVSEFVLVRSVFGQSRHIVLRRWPLRG
ncbi:MAG TPA: 2'-5' RNA ligase family protein [Stellaceae bacterium]|jgi:2'-5' RNA ligase|nr:2'-5' RNA ligase family protein [Stellaceae bacterium]